MRLIDEDDNQLGIMGIDKARALAQERGLDLVEVSPNASPSVCRIMDYGKHLYRQKKQDQKHRSKQKKTEVKGLRLGLRTGQHDLDVKISQARKFLSEGHSVKIALIFRGREITHHELGEEKMLQIKDALQDIAKCDQIPKRQGFQMIMILSPIH